MSKPDKPAGGVAFSSYQRRTHDLGPVHFVHGRYDGLTTAALAHEHLQVLVPLAGRVHLTAGAAGQLLGPGEVAIVLPGTPHATSTLGAEFRFLAVNAPADWLATLAAEVGLAGPPLSGLVVLRDAGLWLQGQQLALALESPPEAPAAFDHLMAAGLVQVGVLALAALARRGAIPPPADEAMLRAVERILSGHGGDLRVEGLAREVGLSPRQLERRFKAAVGLAPRRFLIEVRLAAARELLAASQLTQATIAERVGFKSPEQLSKAFKAAMGMPPGAYRRSQGQTGEN